MRTEQGRADAQARGADADSANSQAEDLGIHVRRVEFALPPDMPRHWCRGQALPTHLLNSLSSVFPIGETFFARSVLRFPDAFQHDSKLSREVRAFVTQEARHHREHDRHIDLLANQGYPGIRWRNRIIDGIFRGLNRYAPVTALATTAAFEHLTATLSRIALRDDRVIHGMDSRMPALWRWHALEELEHKSVAYDVLMRVSTSHALRSFVLIVSTLGLTLEILERAAYMLRQDGRALRWKTWREGWDALFAAGRPADSELGFQPRGVFRDVWPSYAAWYRRDFHPIQLDDRELIVTYQRLFSPEARAAQSEELRPTPAPSEQAAARRRLERAAAGLTSGRPGSAP